MSRSEGVVAHLCLSSEKGTPKTQKPAARFIQNYGIEHDAHASSETHRQVSLLATESIQIIQEKGVDVAPGAFGENLCISGMDPASLHIGDMLEIGGGVRLEITQIGKECHTRCSIYFRAGLCIMPTEGLFARVVTGGEVKEGDPIRRLDPAKKKTATLSFSHLDGRGKARMVDVGVKAETLREAIAVGEVKMAPATVEAIRGVAVAKGDVLAVARLAGIQGAKQTSGLIPLCHPLSLDSVEVDFAFGPDRVFLRSRTRVRGRTGVEMEALTAVTMAALALYDMCKSADKGMELGPFALIRKSGGRSGLYSRKREWGGPSPEEDREWQ